MSCDRLGSFDDDPRAPASDGGGFYKGAPGEWIFGSAGLSMLRNSDNASREGWEQSDCQREQLERAGGGWRQSSKARDDAEARAAGAISDSGPGVAGCR